MKTNFIFFFFLRQGLTRDSGGRGRRISVSTAPGGAITTSTSNLGTELMDVRAPLSYPLEGMMSA